MGFIVFRIVGVVSYFSYCLRSYVCIMHVCVIISMIFKLVLIIFLVSMYCACNVYYSLDVCV